MKYPVGALTLLIGLCLALASCNSPPMSPSQSAAPGLDPVALARQAFDRHDFPAAAPLFRRAIGRDSEKLEFHFKLGICTSRLDLIDETVREFEWVLAHAPVASEEAQVARQWLAAAGHLGPAARSAEGGATASIPDPRVGDSGISGVVRGADPGNAAEPLRRIQVHLIALPGQDIAEQRFTIRTDEAGHYSFARIPAGTYKVTNAIAGPVMWRLRVKLEPGRETTLDLDTSNSVRARDDFPDGG